MIEKNNDDSCSICTLIFVSVGKGMPGLSHALVPAQKIQEVVVWTATRNYTGLFPSWKSYTFALHFVRCAEALQATMCAKCQT
jgi:hypothetical protein